MYIADNANNRIRKVTVSTGIISTIAGTGASSYSGDNGAATSAGLALPSDIALDSAGILSLSLALLTAIYSLCHGIGNVYIADYSNNRVRKVTVSTGVIATVAGDGTAGYSGDNGPATSATMNQPQGVALDSAGIIIRYFCFNHN